MDSSKKVRKLNHLLVNKKKRNVRIVKRFSKKYDNKG